MTDESKTTKQSDAEIIAYYQVVRDAYTQLHKVRFKLLQSILKHAQKHMGEETLIFVLTQEVARNRLENKE